MPKVHPLFNASTHCELRSTINDTRDSCTNPSGVTWRLIASVSLQGWPRASEKKDRAAERFGAVPGRMRLHSSGSSGSNGMFGAPYNADS
jgi:hypothetical protein